MGIAEADMIGHAAGLAASGYTAFASTFAMFASGRAWEQIRNSVAYPHLDVKVCASHAGISVGEDGVSHQATEDIAIMRAIPNMEVFVPCDAAETKAVINDVAYSKKPCYVRLSRSAVEDVYDENTDFDIRKARVIREGKTTAVFACGNLVQSSLQAADILKDQGIDLEVVDVCAIKPCDKEGIEAVLAKYDTVFTAEEHNIIGGLGSMICETACESTRNRVFRIGLEDCYCESGKAAALMHKYKLDGEGVAAFIASHLG
jgi:transketolase